MIDNIFQKLNLKKIYARVYLNLLESGPLPAGQLAKRLNLKRQSVYDYLNELQKKGLVLQTEKLGVKIWQAAPPEKLNEIINDKISKLNDIQDKYNKLLPDLIVSQKSEAITPKFTYYEGSAGVKQIIKDILLYRDLNTQAFWPIKDMLEAFGKEYLTKYGTEQRIKQNIKIKIIVPENKMIDLKKYTFFSPGKKYKREIRIAPKKIEGSMGYWVYGNKVAFISSKKESFGFIVESRELTQLKKAEFEILWKNSKPIKVTYTRVD